MKINAALFLIIAINIGDNSYLVGQDTPISISGKIRDAATDTSLENVEIWFMIEGNLVQGTQTNEYGDFYFQSKFFSKEKEIIIIARKQNEFAEKIYKQPITPGIFQYKIQTIFLSKWDGIPIQVSVKGPGGKPLDQVNILSWNLLGDWEEKGRTDEYGELRFYSKIKPGDPVAIRTQVEGFKNVTVSGTLSNFNEYNKYSLFLDREKTFPYCKCSLIASGVLAASGITSFVWSKSAYKRFENPANANREKDYQHANSLLRASAVSGSLAVLALGAWKLCRHLKTDHTANWMHKNGIKMTSGLDDPGHPGIGIAYNLNR